MTTLASRRFARHHDGVKPISVRAELAIGDGSLRVSRADGSRLFDLGELEVSPRSGSADRFISLPDGSELQVTDETWLDDLPTPERSAQGVSWLEQRLGVAVGSLAGLAVFGAWFWFFGLPWLALQVARQVPFRYERELGESSIRQLERAEWFARSEVGEALENELSRRFARLVAALPQDNFAYRLEFRSAGMGPNAFAFPGGLIVVTDDLVEICTPDEVTAVLAHELAHAHGRHVMQGILSDAGVGAALWAVLGDVSSSGLAVVTVPSMLLELGYSRDLEEQADGGAFELLRRIQLRPALLGDALERIEQSFVVSDTSDGDMESDREDPGGAGVAGWSDLVLEPAAENWVELEGRPPGEGAQASGASGSGWEIDEGNDAESDVQEPSGDTHDLEDEPWSFLSTHPVTKERIARARATR